MHVKQLTGPHIAAIRPTIEKNEVESQGERTTRMKLEVQMNIKFQSNLTDLGGVVKTQ
jgi:hypothetical protein